MANSGAAWVIFILIGGGVLWIAANEGEESAQYGNDYAVAEDVAYDDAADTVMPPEGRTNAGAEVAAEEAALAATAAQEAAVAAAQVDTSAPYYAPPRRYTFPTATARTPVYPTYGYSGGRNYGYNDEDEEEEYREPFDERQARRVAERKVARDSYVGIGTPYGCTIDCSGHEAGFAWRRDNGYVTYGNSRSFHEGAQAFEDEVEERVDDMRDDYESGEDPGY